MTNNYELFGFDPKARKLVSLTKEKFVRYFPKCRKMINKNYEEWIDDLFFDEITPNMYYLNVKNVLLFILKNKNKEYLEKFLTKKGLLRASGENPQKIYDTAKKILNNKNAKTCDHGGTNLWENVSLVQVVKLYKAGLLKKKVYNMETGEDAYRVEDVIKYIHKNKLDAVFSVSQFADYMDYITYNSPIEDFKLNIASIKIKKSSDLMLKTFPKLKGAIE